MKRDGEMIAWGLVLGLIVGGLATLLTAPKSGVAFRRQFGLSMSETGGDIRAVIVPVDPVAESMAEGKAAARRRMTELGRN